MTEEFYTTEVAKINEIISKAESEKKALKKQFIKELPFAPGDKVAINSGHVSLPYVWINKINLDELELDADLHLSVFPPKKDGNRSNRAFNLYCVRVEDVKILEKAEA